MSSSANVTQAFAERWAAGVRLREREHKAAMRFADRLETEERKRRDQEREAEREWCEPEDARKRGRADKGREGG